MPSVVDICNRALTSVGADRITSINDANNRATACNSAYEYVRDLVLRLHPWNCAIKRVALAASTTAPVFLYDYKYQMPSDCLKVLEVDTDYSWVVEAKFILTNQAAPLNVRYTSRETDTAQYDSALFEVMSARLAYSIAWDVTRDAQIVKDAKDNFKELLSVAKLNDAQEGSPSYLREDDWVSVRY